MTISELSPRDRPREKLVRRGKRALGDNELLALVLAEGTRHCNALDLATKVLADVGGLRGLPHAASDQLCRLRGIGETRAARILAAVELGRRTLLLVPPDERPLVTSSRDVYELLAPEFGACDTEHFGVVLLDVRHRVLRTQVLSSGAKDGTYADVPQVFREAFLVNAHAVIAFHNHPSGDPTPSVEDRALTKRLRTAGELMGIELIDHLIIANDRFYSFRSPHQQTAEEHGESVQRSRAAE